MVEYRHYFNEPAFWAKLQELARKDRDHLGWLTVENALQLYYACKDPATDSSVAADIQETLGYFLAPAEHIPINQYRHGLSALWECMIRCQEHLTAPVTEKAYDKTLDLMGTLEEDSERVVPGSSKPKPDHPPLYPSFTLENIPTVKYREPEAVQYLGHPAIRTRYWTQIVAGVLKLMCHDLAKGGKRGRFYRLVDHFRYWTRSSLELYQKYAYSSADQIYRNLWFQRHGEPDILLQRLVDTVRILRLDPSAVRIWLRH